MLFRKSREKDILRWKKKNVEPADYVLRNDKEVLKAEGYMITRQGNEEPQNG